MKIKKKLFWEGRGGGGGGLGRGWEVGLRGSGWM